MQYAVWILAVFLASALPALAQERTFTWTLTESEMNYIGALIDIEKAKPSGQLVQHLADKIQAQITQQVQASQKAALDAIEKQVRDRVDAEKNREPPP